MADLIDPRAFREFAKDLRKVDDAVFRREANKQLKHVADEAVGAAQRAAMAIPSNGAAGRSQGRDKRGRYTSGYQKALRPLLARAVTPQYRSGGKDAGVSVRVSGARLGNRKGAEKVLEFGGRHPVYGGSTWVQQAAKPWFRAALAPFREKAQTALLAAMDDIAARAGFRGR